MKILSVSERDDDRSARQVAAAGIFALLLGGIFLVRAVEGPQPVTPPAPAHAEPSKGAPPAKGKPGATASPAQGGTAGAPGAAAGSTAAGQVPAATAAAEAARPAASATRGSPTAGRSWAAASCGALLWALACCAVGAFLGFIFGIPRSLSSDTARTVNPAQTRTIEAAREKTAALKAAAVHAAADRDKAVGDANEADAKLARAGEEAHASLLEQKSKLDKIALEKTKAADNAEAQAKKNDETGSTPDASATAASAHPLNARGPSTAVNTNLEQISDWLTKIIVGVSLVNSEKIGAAVMMASREMAKSFGGEPMNSLALAMLTYFGVIGLLGGYLLTRLYLQRAFEEIGSSSRADQPE